MMKRIYIPLAAVSALAVAAPLAAQPWRGEQSQSAQLQARFDAGVQSGAISRREAMPLRAQMRQLVQLERQYSRAAGINRWERASLARHGRALSLNIASAEQSYDRRSGGRTDDRDETFGEGRDGNLGTNRGDRFAGDLRVGEAYSRRHAPLPAMYRARYQDSDSAYFGYDNNRVYQIDRVTGIIVAMFDVGR